MTNNKLDKKKLDYYKKLLITLREKMVHDVNNMSKVQGGQENESSDISGHVQHMADVATDMYDREFSLGLAANERDILHKIDSALKRIEDKSFGLCGECDKTIPFIRLDAIPYVETCLKCQEKIENGK